MGIKQCRPGLVVKPNTGYIYCVGLWRTIRQLYWGKNFIINISEGLSPRSCTGLRGAADIDCILLSDHRPALLNGHDFFTTVNQLRSVEAGLDQHLNVISRVSNDAILPLCLSDSLKMIFAPVFFCLIVSFLLESKTGGWKRLGEY